MRARFCAREDTEAREHGGEAWTERHVPGRIIGAGGGADLGAGGDGAGNKKDHATFPCQSGPSEVSKAVGSDR